jgi:hypothetical protein
MQHYPTQHGVFEEKFKKLFSFLLVFKISKIIFKESLLKYSETVFEKL